MRWKIMSAADGYAQLNVCTHTLSTRGNGDELMEYNNIPPALSTTSKLHNITYYMQQICSIPATNWCYKLTGVESDGWNERN